MMMPAMPMGGGIVSIFQQPMTFQIRRNFFQMGGEMDVLCNGAPYYRCRSVMNPLGVGYNFQITDLMGNQLVYIQHDLMMGLPTYTLFARGVPMGRLKQDFTINKQFELLNLITGEFIVISGDWFGGNFSFLRNGAFNVAQVMMNSAMADSYLVQVSPGEETLFILSAVLTIEKLCHEYQPGSFMGGMMGGAMMGGAMMGGAMMGGGMMAAPMMAAPMMGGMMGGAMMGGAMMGGAMMGAPMMMGGMVEMVTPMGGVVEMVTPMGGVMPMGGMGFY